MPKTQPLRVVKTALTVLAPSLVITLVPLWSYVVQDRYRFTFTMRFLWFASGLLSSAIVAVLCIHAIDRSWPKTALVVAAAAALLVPTMFALVTTAVVGLNEFRIEPLGAMGFHIVCVASAALLYRLSRRKLVMVFAAAVVAALAVHTWQYDLPTAAMEGDIGRVRLILRVFPDHGRKSDALFLSAWAGHADLVALLLDRGVAANYAQQPGGWTPLHAASAPATGTSRAQYAAIRRDLVAHGADASARNADGRTPLFLAATDSVPTVQFLLDHGADINARDNRGTTCLHAAVPWMVEDTTMLEFLIDTGADLHTTDDRGRTVMHYIAGNEQVIDEPVLTFLLEHGLDINGHDFDGSTPLHIAAGHGIDAFPGSRSTWHGTVNAVRTLIEHGADPGARDYLGRTPLHHFAAYNLGDSQVLRSLIGRGADPRARDTQGRTPLDLARERGNERLISLVGRYTPADVNGSWAETSLVSSPPAPRVAMPQLSIRAPLAPSGVDLVEASAIAVRGRGKVAVIGGDETRDRLWAVSLDDTSAQWELPFPKGTPPLDDVEGLAPWGDDALLITCSQGLTKPKEKDKLRRTRLALVTLSPDATRVIRVRVYDGLRYRLIEHLTANAAGLFDTPEAIAAAGPERGGLNVEGLAPWKGQLLLGLRSPVAKGGAVVVPLREPEKLFRGMGGARPDFGDPFVLPTRPHEAIRDLTPFGDSLLVLLGPETGRDEGPFRVVRWNPSRNELKDVVVPGLKDVPRPEGIAVDPQGRLLVVQDQKPPLPAQILFRLEMKAAP